MIESAKERILNNITWYFDPSVLMHPNETLSFRIRAFSEHRRHFRLTAAGYVMMTDVVRLAISKFAEVVHSVTSV